MLFSSYSSFNNEVVLAPANQSLPRFIPISCLRGLGQKLAAGPDLTGAGWFTTVPRELLAPGTAVGVAECRCSWGCRCVWLLC